MRYEYLIRYIGGPLDGQEVHSIGPRTYDEINRHAYSSDGSIITIVDGLRWINLQYLGKYVPHRASSASST